MEDGITLGEWLAILTIAGSIAGGIGWLVFRVDRMYYRVESMISPVSKIIEMDFRLQQLWRERTTINHSPTVLKAEGKKILKDTNIQVFTDKYFDEIVRSVNELKPQNAWEAQEFLIKILYSYKNRVKNEMDISSFSSDMDTIMFVAAINIRDEVIKRLAFRREDIDRFDPNKP